MSATRRLVLYGNSILLAGLKADLQSHIPLELVTIDAGCPDAEERLRTSNPSVVIFDVSAVRPDFSLSLLRDRPELLLLAVDPSRDEMLVLSGRPERALSTQDLVRVIDSLSESRNPRPISLDLNGPRQAVPAWMTGLPRRQRMLALALVGIAGCVVLAITLSLSSSNLSTPLTGTAVGPGDGVDAPEFVAGIVLGGMVIGLWFWFRGRRMNGQ